MRTKLTVVTALAGSLLATCLVSESAKAMSVPVLRGAATPGIVTLVGRGGGRGGVGRVGVGVGRAVSVSGVTMAVSVSGVTMAVSVSGVTMAVSVSGVTASVLVSGVTVSVLVSGVTMADATALALIITGTAGPASTAEGTRT